MESKTNSSLTESDNSPSTKVVVVGHVAGIDAELLSDAHDYAILAYVKKGRDDNAVG